MKPPHFRLLTHYAVFLVGMIAGAYLAHNPPLWIAMIVLTALVIGLIGYLATRKPRKKKLPVRRASRVVKRNVRIAR